MRPLARLALPALAASVLLPGVALGAGPATAPALTAFPSGILPGCRGGRAELYDECSDQRALFARALEEANRTDKVLLVSYGAEWCIWCHVFDAYIHGEADVFTHSFGDPEDDVLYRETIYERAKEDVGKLAVKLASFAADRFVLVHIEDRFAPGGYEVLERTGALEQGVDGFPFIFTVTPDGRFAANLIHDRIEVRRDTADWFRGYDRRALIAELRAMYEAAR